MAVHSEALRSIVKAAVAANPSDIDRAVEQAYAKAKRAPEYAEWVEALVRGELRSMIHDARHTINTAIRRERGEFGGKAKVGLSDAVSRAAVRSVLDTYIDGRLLGDLFGKELATVAAKERASGDGHYRNVRMLDLLRPLVPDERTVREAVTPAKADGLWARAVKAGKPALALAGN